MLTGQRHKRDVRCACYGREEKVVHFLKKPFQSSLSLQQIARANTEIRLQERRGCEFGVIFTLRLILFIFVMPMTIIDINMVDHGYQYQHGEDIDI